MQQHFDAQIGEEQKAEQQANSTAEQERISQIQSDDRFAKRMAEANAKQSWQKGGGAEGEEGRGGEKGSPLSDAEGNAPEKKTTSAKAKEAKAKEAKAKKARGKKTKRKAAPFHAWWEEWGSRVLLALFLGVAGWRWRFKN
jgi:hypothetical protein